MTEAKSPTTREPAQVFHPSVFIREEMKARRWDRRQLARHMPGDYVVNLLSVRLYLDVAPTEPDLRIGDGEDFGAAFGVPGEFFRNLEAAWLRRVKQ